MQRLPLLTFVVFAPSFFAVATGGASAFQKHFNADPGAVWAACGANGGSGGYDPHAGVICTKDGCDGNPKHTCIIDCTAAGKCTSTTPNMVRGQFTLSEVLAGHSPLASTTITNASLSEASPHGYGVPPGTSNPTHPPENVTPGTFGPSQ